MQYNYVMVGADPSTNQTALITPWIIPVKLILSDNSVWDPVGSGPGNPLSSTMFSPIFDATTNYTQGGVNVGTTQYIDAYQRANFWSIVQNNPNSHLLLSGPSAGVRVLPELTLNVPAQFGKQGMKLGVNVALVDINYFDQRSATTWRRITSSTRQVSRSSKPPTLIWLQGNSCCIGGYHSANGAQTYAHFTYITTPGVFSQDVSALSHEVGEWADDPLYPHQNNTPCGGLENGDPLAAVNRVILTARGNMCCMGSRITCRTW